LCVTALVAYLIANTSLIRLFFNVNAVGQVMGMSALGWLALFAPFVMVFAFGWVLMKGTVAQVQGVFWGFAAIMGASLAPIILMYTGASVTRIFLITAAMFGGMSIYGYVTKRDLTAVGSFMIMGVWGIIIASIVNLFLKSPGLYYAISFLSVIAFTVLTAYDTQKIRQLYMEQDSSDTMTRKAISGALALYMDFINIFIALLNLFGDRR
jgi:integral membrane protein, interacts with ftsh